VSQQFDQHIRLTKTQLMFYDVHYYQCKYCYVLSLPASLEFMSA